MAGQRRDENLREVILDAAERLLGGGPGALTTRNVLASAGVSTGTLFHYFPTIDELVLAVAQRAAGRQTETFGDLASDGFETVLARLFDPARRDTVLPWLRQRAIEAPQLRAGLRQYDGEVLARYEQGLRRAAPQLGLAEDFDVAAAIEVVRALAEGYQLRMASDTLAVESERFLKVALELILAGARADGGGR